MKKNISFEIVLIFLISLKGRQLVESNGRFLEPPNRSSIWRFPEFKKFDPPVNYNDNHLDCGGTLVDEDERDSCGICGDPITDPVPRPNEDGGVFSKGIVVRTYKSGQKIPVTVQLTYGQKGFFDFKLCAQNDVKSHLDPNCYEKNILDIEQGGKKYFITESAARYYNLTVTLPEMTKCDRCVLRWRYRAGNNWGSCGNGKPGASGCGPQTTFHGCSDIAII